MTITFEEVRQKLIEQGVATSAQSLNCTMGYFLRWQTGETLDFTKSSVAVQRARLRKIGIDIKKPYSAY